jgi:uncharacterized membrane protein
MIIRRFALYAAAVFFMAAGAMHFLSPAPYLKIMPPWIPWHAAMVGISGVAEFAGGVGLLIPRLRRAAAWGLVALLIAVFPANIYMATNHIPLGQTVLSPAVLWGRLALQPLMIWWVLWSSLS